MPSAAPIALGAVEAAAGTLYFFRIVGISALDRSKPSAFMAHLSLWMSIFCFFVSVNEGELQFCGVGAHSASSAFDCAVGNRTEGSGTG